MSLPDLMNKSQTEMLLEHFKLKPTITAIEAAAMFRIRSLSRRINDLEAQGYLFSRIRRKDSTGQRYVRYHFLGKKKLPLPAPLGLGQVGVAA